MTNYTYSALMPSAQRREAIKARLNIYPLKNVYEQLEFHSQMHRGSKYENRVKSDIDWLANYLYKTGKINGFVDLIKINEIVGNKYERKGSKVRA